MQKDVRLKKFFYIIGIIPKLHYSSYVHACQSIYIEKLVNMSLYFIENVKFINLIQYSTNEFPSRLVSHIMDIFVGQQLAI